MPRKKTQPKSSDGNGNRETPAEPKRRSKRPAEPDTVVNQAPSDEAIARKAYALWENRGRPFGSPDEDWYRAMHELYASGSSNSQK